MCTAETTNPVEDLMKDLILKYLDGRLSPDQVQILQDWINADEENARTFVRYCILHSQMRTQCMEEDLRESLTVFTQTDPVQAGQDTGLISSEVILGADDSGSEAKVQRIREFAEHELQTYMDEQERLRREEQSQNLRRSNAWQDFRSRMLDRWSHLVFSVTAYSRFALRAWISVSVILLLVLVIHAQYRQRVIATLVEEMDAVWATAPETKALRAGVLDLREGFAEIQFNNNVKVLLEAPCRFDLHSPKKVSLHEGTLTAKVPKQAVGFTVKTASSRVVDLGTEFGVRIGEDGKTETAVFTGSLRFSGLRKSPALGVRSLIVRRNQRAETSPQGILNEGVKPLAKDHGFLLSWQDIHELKQREHHERLYRPQVSGQCLVLNDRPVSLSPGFLESSDHVFVFLERQDVELEQNWVGTMVAPGPVALQGPLMSSLTLPAGTRVDSYIVHFDPENPLPGKNVSRCQAQIRFVRPIVSVITATNLLLEADAVFGDPTITYPSGGRGVEAYSDGDSMHQLVISEDRRTLSLNITASRSMDQMRVLVQAVQP